MYDMYTHSNGLIVGGTEQPHFSWCLENCQGIHNANVSCSELHAPCTIIVLQSTETIATVMSWSSIEQVIECGKGLWSMHQNYT